MKNAFLSCAMLALFLVPVASAAPPAQAGQPKATAQGQAGAHAATPASHARATAHTATLTREFVSYDSSTHTVTLRDEKGETTTAPLDKKAVQEMAKLHAKAGDRLILTFRNSASGEHEAVTGLKLAKKA
jgi:hypothetical protein